MTLTIIRITIQPLFLKDQVSGWWNSILVRWEPLLLLHKSKRGKGETKRWGFFQKKGQQIAGVKWCVEIDYSLRVQLCPPFLHKSANNFWTVFTKSQNGLVCTQEMFYINMTEFNYSSLANILMYQICHELIWGFVSMIFCMNTYKGSIHIWFQIFS